MDRYSGRSDHDLLTTIAANVATLVADGQALATRVGNLERRFEDHLVTANTDSLRLTTLENEHRTQVEPDIDALESWRSEMRGAWRVILVVVSILTSAVGLNILLMIATLAQHKP